MADLCRRFPVDALHLDQTLCIFNDHTGRIDGLNMIRGNDALHEELAAALPQVALSGEGLNEVTCRREAFAQRHVWGLHHAEGTWNEASLRCAHPVSSYLFAPFTTVYGYLGMVAPERGQLYAAWNEAYEHFGVIPTLRPSMVSLAAAREPGARGACEFLRQFLDEVGVWQRARLDPDPDGTWPADVAFPFRAADGARAARMMDGRLVAGERTVSRTVHGSNRVDAAGLYVPGWPAHGSGRILGLDPARRYALLPGVADTNAFHVCDLPEGVVVETAVAGRGLACVRTRAILRRILDPVRDLRSAACGWRTRSGVVEQATGPLTAASGASFLAVDNGLSAHPPYKDGAAGGEAFARFRVLLPPTGRPRFASHVSLGKDSVGTNRSDGVTFRVSAATGNTRFTNAVHCISEDPEPLDLDLSSVAGRTVEIELAVHPGPAGNPSFDRALWTEPRIEAGMEVRGGFAVAGTQRWACAVGAGGRVPADPVPGRFLVGSAIPGAVFMLASPPAAVEFPVDLLKATYEVVVLADGVRPDCRIAGAHPTVRVSGGVSRPTFIAHPPDRGTTTIHLPMRLPAAPGRFMAYTGLGDGSKSGGVGFVVEVNGREVARQRRLPGGWEPMEADLSPWAGKDIVLSLTTDADGPFNFDWGLWGEPRILARP
jgi:hypothetical protein